MNRSLHFHKVLHNRCYIRQPRVFVVRHTTARTHPCCTVRVVSASDIVTCASTRGFEPHPQQSYAHSCGVREVQGGWLKPSCAQALMGSKPIHNINLFTPFFLLDTLADSFLSKSVYKPVFSLFANQAQSASREAQTRYRKQVILNFNPKSPWLQNGSK